MYANAQSAEGENKIHPSGSHRGGVHARPILVSAQSAPHVGPMIVAHLISAPSRNDPMPERETVADEPFFATADYQR